MHSIYLIRHGQASFDADDYDQLSTLGETQSRLLGDWFLRTGQHVDQVVIGGNLRHRQTAQQCLHQFRGDAPNQTEKDWIIERGFDEFDHEQVILKHCTEFANFQALKRSLNEHPKPRHAFQAMFTAAIHRWVSGEHDDYSESWLQFQERCRLALARLIAASDDTKATWIFTSGGTISALLQQVLDISDQRIFDLNASLINTGVSKLQVRNAKLSLVYLNNPAHLEIHQNSELQSYR